MSQLPQTKKTEKKMEEKLEGEREGREQRPSRTWMGQERKEDIRKVRKEDSKKAKGRGDLRGSPSARSSRDPCNGQHV